jgi:diguanylate cyclase (GGDEF)-like protein
MPTLPRLRPRRRAEDSPARSDRFRDGQAAPGPAEREAEYRRAHLRGQRTLIRVACSFGALFAVLRGAEQTVIGFWHPAQPVALTFVVVTSLVLALIVWTRAFERIYLRLANLVVPIRSAVAAAFLVGIAARGEPDALMFLPLILIGPFFFLGLDWRVGLVSGIATLLSFGSAAIVFGLGLPTALRAGALVCLVLVAGAIAARQLDRIARKGFAESNRISERAEHDALTGLKNRGIFDEQLSALWHRAIENRCGLAIFLIDVDHFKRFNDRYGHQAGDRVLRRVAQTLDRLVERPLDVLTRYGGEEFAAIVYDLGAEECEALAERMRLAVRGLDGGQRGPHAPPAVSISIGVGLVEPSDGRRPIGAVQLADQALYEAKRRGRDRVVLLDQTAHRLLQTGVFDRASFAREA